MPHAQSWLRQAVPSMFHRRLWLLVVCAAGVTTILTLQMARLTVAQGAYWRGRAESAMVQRKLIPTARGRILDRQMRVLAMDRPSYDVCVAYPVITGEWAYRQGRLAAYRANKELWAQIDEHERAELTASYQQPFEAQEEELWRSLCELGGISREELEQRKATIVRRVNQIASAVWDRRLRRRLEDDEDETVTLADVAQPIGEQVAAHALLTDLDRRTLIRVRQLLADAAQQPEGTVWPHVDVQPSKHRHYPLETMTVVTDRSTLPSPLRRDTPLETAVEGVGAHFIGAMRRVWKEDAERRPYRVTDESGQPSTDLGGYLPGDRAGHWGIEKEQEDWLRGTRGQVVQQLDTQEEQRLEPVGGHDAVLTVDIQLQARIQALMDPGFGLMKVQPWHSPNPPSNPLHPQIGDPLCGAAVVLDVTQSQVLAAVSMPGFSRRQLRESPDSVWQDKLNQPFMNRPVARAYQPGSIVKPLVLAAAISDGKIGYGQTIECHGHLDPDFTDRYRCWIFKHFNATHGPLTGDAAIARSCNIFFYTLGRRLGARRLVEWYDRLGLGHTTGCGLQEVRGDLPDLSKADQPYANGFSAADAIFMAIGQGPVRWTPLQAAGSYAALARGGYAISPSFIMVGDQPESQTGTDLNWDPAGVQQAMRGMEKAINRSYGTAHGIAALHQEPIFNIPGVELYGKSGTAQGVSLWIDANNDGRYDRKIDPIVRRGDHAWVVCLVKRPGSPRADFVMAVVVEYAGSGGAVAGPIANQILHALRAEGYL